MNWIFRFVPIFILAIWLAIIATIVLVAYTVATLGVSGIAREAGAAVASAKQGYEQGAH